MDRQGFVEFLAPIIGLAIQNTGTIIQPSVIMARAIIESQKKDGSFPSTLAKEANNYFGITASNKWTGKKYETVTGENAVIKGKKIEYTLNGLNYYRRAFRAYDTPYDSVVDFIHLIEKNPIYSKALQTNSAIEQATEIAKAGYATAKNSIELFKKVVNSVEKNYKDILKTVVKATSEIVNTVKKNSPLLMLFFLISIIYFLTN